MKIRFSVPEATDPRRESGIALPEQQSKRKAPRLRWIAITLIALSPALWVLIYFASGWLWLESHAYVVLDEVIINAPANGVVTALHAQEGQQVSVGAPLIRLDDPESRAELDVLGGGTRPEATEVAGIAVQRERADVTAFRHQYRLLSERVRTLRDLAAQGAATRGEVLAIESERLSLLSRIQALDGPGGLHSPAERLARIEALMARLRSLEVRAPTSGITDNLVVAAGQVVSRGDPMMVLRHGRPHLIAFVRGQDVPLAEPGRRVTIILPSGRKREGHILGPAPSTRRLPEELAGALDPRNPRLQVLIEPGEMGPEALVHHLPVTIRTLRFRWPWSSDVTSRAVAANLEAPGF